jgi:hypothetical protein
MHSVANHVSVGMMVVLPGPEEDHIPDTKASLALMHMASGTPGLFRSFNFRSSSFRA